MSYRPLDESFFRQPVETVARELIGCLLVRRLRGQELVARLVETEAYCGVEDRAAHTFGGRRTARNEVMYGPAAHAYVYFIYGMHHCMNAVTGAIDEPTAVLLRAAEPIAGADFMQQNRNWTRPVRAGDLCGGPGKLCQGLGIDRSQNGCSLTAGDLFLAEPLSHEPLEIACGPRVGIGYAQEAVSWPLRFALAGNRHVSRPRL